MSSTLETLEQICGIFDMDGYELDRVFYTREAAFAGMDAFIESETYKIPRHVYDDASEKQRRTIGFIMARIHGLPFFPRRSEGARPLKDFERFVDGCYRETKTNTRTLVAYKGGHYERDILDKFDIPSVNLEDFGCPRYDELIRQDGYADSRDRYTCVAHRLLKKQYHCTLNEVYIFRKWLDDRIAEEKKNVVKTFDDEPEEEVWEIEDWV